MDYTSTELLIELSKSLAALALKGTVTSVNSRIKAIRDEKNTEKVRATYDEIVNELLIEREEAVRIAQTYKNEIERIEISDEDIQHLHVNCRETSGNHKRHESERSIPIVFPRSAKGTN